MVLCVNVLHHKPLEIRQRGCIRDLFPRESQWRMHEFYRILSGDASCNARTRQERAGLGEL